MRPFWNAARRKHAAESLRTVALGQLAFFGFQALAHRQWLILAATIIAAIGIDVVALVTIKGDNSDER